MMEERHKWATGGLVFGLVVGGVAVRVAETHNIIKPAGTVEASPNPTSVVPTSEVLVPPTTTPAAAETTTLPATTAPAPTVTKIQLNSGLECDSTTLPDIVVSPATAQIGDTLSLLKAVATARKTVVPSEAIKGTFDEARAGIFVHDFMTVNGLTAAQVPNTDNFPAGTYSFYTNCVDTQNGNIRVT